MYAPHQAPEPIEKIRKPQWTVENTKRTQAVIDRLQAARRASLAVNGYNTEIVHVIEAAMRRFHELDPQLVIPFL